ncbi:TonB-dependent siderophore receptor [Rhodonellum sp.]|uniref:TonB-dependent receptor plug domain-containing protein n=1 Tax=Rhodonellum sp. TaxID=2231180 RepID=UPI00271FEA08|nr:TonB-dependent receptor [Rhodonellum sp.]MDO9551153.1 TonB-dependent receptor [Rhodonellum sp.]
MKKFLPLIFLILLHVNGFSQVLFVSDQETGQPLAFVSISHLTSKRFSTTDQAGKADISSFRGLDQIEIRLFGYKAQKLNYTDLEQQKFLVHLLPSQITLQQAIVSASSWSQSRQEIPARVTRISKEETALRNPQTAADLLGISGDVFIQKSQQGGGSPMIRGFSTNRLLYTIDGVRMNTAIFRIGNIQNVISLDPFATESTDIYFGPGAIIYGSDAIGAVMSFQTLTPRLSDTNMLKVSGSAVLRASSANQEKTGHVDVALGGEKWASVTSFSSNNFGDLKMGKHGPEEYLRPNFVQRIENRDEIVPNKNPRIQNPSGYSQVNLMQKIRFKPNEAWDFRYGFHYSESSSYSRYDRHIRFRANGLPRSAEWSYGPQTWMMHHLQAAYEGETKLFDQLTIRLARQDFEESRIDRNFNDPIRRTRLEEVVALSANIDFFKNVGERAKLYYGFESIRNAVDSRGTDENIDMGTKVTGPARYPISDWSSHAAYATYQQKISKNSLIQGGLRYNQFILNADFSNNMPFYPLPFETAAINKGAVTASMGWVFNPTDKWMMHVNASTGFRSPNVDDIGKIFDSEPGTVLVPNPNLDAEYAYNAELNVGKVFGENVMLDLTAYYTLLDNAIVRRDFLLNGQDSILYDGELSRVFALQNAAFARIYGLQAALEIKLPRGFTFITRLNYQKGTEETDDGIQNPSRHAPPLFGSARMEYKRKKLRLEGYTEFSGKMDFNQLPLEEKGKPEIYAIDENGRPYSPSWLTLNLKAFYQLSDLFSISGGLENIADVRYRTYSSGIVAPGRNFILSLRANF